MGVKEIFPLTLCDKNFDLMLPFAPMFPNYLLSSSCNFSIPIPNVDACIGNLHFGILIRENTLCLIPHS
jgi:hypothetical protein